MANSLPTTVQDAAAPSSLLRLNYFWYVAAAFALMIAAIVSRDLWFLNFVHVFAGALWTSIDLFMGFVLGPVLRRLDLPVRRAILTRLMPRNIFILPTVSIITPTSGWYLAEYLGYFDLSWPQSAWLIAALVISTLLGIQGLGILLPTNLRVCLELQKAQPDFARMGRWMRRYLVVIAFQGVMQITIIVIMARFAMGL
jgi:hypothetical protein